MRYQKNHKEAVRQDLVSNAGALIKANGFAASGIDAIAKSANLSGGGFYSHFASKTDLLVAIIDNEVTRTQATLFSDALTVDNVSRWLSIYLSSFHALNADKGCILPSLLPEIARASLETREHFSLQMTNWVRVLEPIIPDSGKAYSFLALISGSIALARALSDPKEQEALLKASLDNALLMINVDVQK